MRDHNHGHSHPWQERRFYKPYGARQGVWIVDLPPYSPELNPCKQLWDIVKDSLSNKVFETVVDRGGIGRDALYIDPPDAIRQHRLDPHR